jgi:hypothetical protein
MHFLVIYDRASATLLEETSFEVRSEAMSARYRAERQYAGRPTVESVVLDAANPEALRRTHGRYFKTTSELAATRTGPLRIKVSPNLTP